MGIRLDEDFTESELNTLSREGFARERLGWWSDEAGGNPALSKTKWAECEANPAPAPTDGERVAYGVKFSADGQSYALSAAAKPKDGPVLVECLEVGTTSNGTTALANWIIERKNVCAICVIDGKSNTATLERKLLDGGFPRRGIKVASPAEVIAAASMTKDAVDEGALIHSGQPTLTESAVAAQKREIGSGGGWGFGDGEVPCGPIESASLALWGVKTTKRRPGRKARTL